MQVILLEPIAKLGTTGSIVNVKNGYGRNFLIPRKKAIRATKDNLTYFEQQKDIFEKENLIKKDHASKIAIELEGLTINITRQASDDGRLYGSVNARDINTAIKETINIDVPHDQILINNKLKQIGSYDIYVHLHSEIKIKILLNISRNAQQNTFESNV